MAGDAVCMAQAPTSTPIPDGIIVFTVVYDNYPLDQQLGTDWGFACIIKGLSETILFDTGRIGDLLLSNMAKLGFGPVEIDSIVLSHNHFDHTDGLISFLNANPDVKVILPSAFPSDFKHEISQLASAVVETDGPYTVCEKAWTTGVLGSGIKEQGLCIETSDGVVVITGCAHPGIVQMMSAVNEIVNTPIYAAMGGFHMFGDTAGNITDVIADLKTLGIQKVGPCHCSGSLTRQLMNEHFGDGYMLTGVGAVIDFFLAPSGILDSIWMSYK
jgi:7,8-dihydropterin-6-yl-methyl-4-(beta-D-ribofuranosyl)aminobenzene 5'-phosphate synthase